MSSDEERLKKVLREKEDAHEALCLRCGACCGAYDGDPCLHLQKAADGQYFCDDYAHRLGSQKTVNGTRIRCVQITDILMSTWPGDQACPYKKKRRR